MRPVRSLMRLHRPTTTGRNGQNYNYTRSPGGRRAPQGHHPNGYNGPNGGKTLVG